MLWTLATRTLPTLRCSVGFVVQAFGLIIMIVMVVVTVMIVMTAPVESDGSKTNGRNNSSDNRESCNSGNYAHNMQ